MSCRLIIRSCTFLAVALAASFSGAQDRYLAEIYGAGVRAVYRGDNGQADEYLSSAINQGLDDARAYYFRAVNKMLSGNAAGAESDIRMGADLEINGRGTYDVGRALERVQGPHRIRFEAVRRQALLTAKRAKANRAPRPDYPNDRDYLRDPVPAAPTDLLPGSEVPDGDDPFLKEDDEMEETPTEPPAEDEEVPADDVMEDDDPFGEETDPFADETDDMGEEDLGDELPADDTGDVDPFGDDAGLDDMGDVDPFGDDAGLDDMGDAAEDVPPAAEIEEGADTEADDPFEDGEDDPFGDGAALETPVKEENDTDDDLKSLFE